MKKKLKKIGITIIIGLIYFYFLVPPLNLSSLEFWIFVILILCVYSLIGSTQNISFGKIFAPIKRKDNYILYVILIIVSLLFLSFIVFSPFFQSKLYSGRIVVDENNNNFNEDVKPVDFNALPIIDKDSSEKLGDRVMGQMPELVSQFTVSNLYTQINYKDDIVRVTPLEYNNIFKYFSNRKDGIKGYIIVNSVNGESSLIKLNDGLKYMDSAIFKEDLNRYLRFKYPTKIFGEKAFEIDDEGNPYWIVPTIQYKGIGLLKEISGAIILNPINGESKYYKVDEVPTWVDHVYSASLIIDQVNDWGLYRGGYFNSIFGQKNVVSTTEGYNYTIMNNDVYLYTGITSAASDESNIGFILSNLRTKETKYYAVPGAEEFSAMASAEGQVQQMRYKSTFPLMVNLNNKPTYFVSLKDNAGLVKMYAFIDVINYQKVVVTDASKGIEEAASNYLNNEGIIVDEKTIKYETIKITSITMALMNGNSYYYILDENNNKYKVSVKVNEKVIPFLKNNQQVKIGYTIKSDLTEIMKLEKN